MENQSEILDTLPGDADVANDIVAAAYGSAIPWRVVVMLLVVFGFQGYAATFPTVAAPWFSKDFHLSDPAMAKVFAGFALSSFGALALARMADRIGRRRVLMWSAIAMPIAALGAATAHEVVAFVAFVIVVEAFLGAALTCSVVMLAELLPVPRRADGQSWAGLATAVGGGLCVFLAPIYPRLGMSWRWLLAIPVAGIVILPTVVRCIPESTRWRRQAREVGSRPTHFYDIFVPLYRKRAITIIVCSFFAYFSVEGVNSYSYFHAVSVIGLSADFASAFTIIGGGVGMLGFPIGAWAAERYGRVPTIVTCGTATSAIALAYYWGPPNHFAHPALWLGVAFLFMNATTNATTVASLAAVTELLPTALRGTMMGWVALTTAFGALSAEATIATFASAAGGISVMTGWLSLLGIPGAILFGMIIDETRGLSLDAAAKEAAFHADR
jgi:MFS transporter, SP family, major inositol transporter